MSGRMNVYACGAFVCILVCACKHVYMFVRMPWISVVSLLARPLNKSRLEKKSLGTDRCQIFMASTHHIAHPLPGIYTAGVYFLKSHELIIFGDSSIN